MITLGIAMETENFSPSQYANFNFNSLCMFNGVMLGAGADGIMELEGDTDNGVNIRAFFQLPSTDLGAHNQKKVRSLILSGEQKGHLKLTLVADNTNNTDYYVDLNGVMAQGSVKVDLNSDDIGRFVGLLVENIDGADFSIDVIDVLVLATVMEPATHFILGRNKVVFPVYTGTGTGI
jgi:hypothetical protein